MNLKPLDGTRVWIDTGELDVFAQVVPAFRAKPTRVAGHTRLNGDACARRKVCDTLSALQDYSGSLVAYDPISAEDATTDCAGFPEVYVRPAP